MQIHTVFLLLGRKEDVTRVEITFYASLPYFPRCTRCTRPPEPLRFLQPTVSIATAISSPNSASLLPLQRRNRGYKEPRFRVSCRLRSSTRSTLLPSLLWPRFHLGEVENPLELLRPRCRVNRGKAPLSRSNRSEREREREDFRGIQCPRGL